MGSYDENKPEVNFFFYLYGVFVLINNFLGSTFADFSRRGSHNGWYYISWRNLDDNLRYKGILVVLEMYVCIYKLYDLFKKILKF